VQQRSDAPVDPVRVRPAVRADQEVVDVLSDVQQQEVLVGLMESKPF
jgi:hypothetical protein